MAQIGSFALLLAFALSVYCFFGGVLALFYKNDPQWNRVGETARRAGVVVFGAVFLAALALPGAPEKHSPVEGRWDITVHGRGGDYPSWVEVRKSGFTTLVGSFVGRTGSARPVARVEFKGGVVRFCVPPQWERRKGDLTFEGRLDGDRLAGQTTDDEGRRVKWTARRAPALKRAGPPRWGKPVELFNGKDLSGWKARSREVKNGWGVRKGVLMNARLDWEGAVVNA